MFLAFSMSAAAINNTTSKALTPTGVHIVGSIPLPSADAVFSKLPTALPGRLRSLPDGETGDRENFTRWQRNVFHDAGFPQILRQYNSTRTASLAAPTPTAAEIDAVLATIRAFETHYDTVALTSYETFTARRAAGIISPETKFQVSLPTPLNAMICIADGWQASLEPLYEAALVDALQRIEEGIPHADLVVQWDVAAEVAMLEGVTEPHFAPFFASSEPVREGVLRRLVRMVGSVAADVEVGLHLCYGDMAHRHFVEPRDLGLLCEVLAEVKTRVARSVEWVHMPIPKTRIDEAYFAPLRDLQLGDTRLYLGLVHYDDLDGTRQRVKTAAKVLQGREFGVATECGMGRTPAEQLDSILAISAAVSRPYNDSS